METPLLITKFFIPKPRPSLVSRTRLIDRLQSILTNPLTLVSAPAGFGKTTVLTQWIADNKSRFPFTWVQLDERDNDPTRFWEYFICALQKIKENTCIKSLDLLHAPQPYPVESILTSLINDIGTISSDFAIVLDDYHLIKTDAIHIGITFLLDHIPPKMHLVIATRTDPALPLSRFRGKGMMLEIGADDLKFTLEEAAALLRGALGTAITEEDIKALNEKTEGWVAGLTMATLSIGKRKDIGGFIVSFTGSQRYIMDYLVEEVLRQLPTDLNEFLLNTSILGRLSAPLCNIVTGRANSQDVLVNLEKTNLFLIPLDDSRQWYRYHHLFAELLRHQLEMKSGPEEITTLHRQASQWYEDLNFFDDAIHHAMAAKDWETTIRLVRNIADGRVKRGEVLTLPNWLKQVPDEVLRTDLHLYSLYSYALVYTGQLQTAETALDYLEENAGSDNNLRGEAASSLADLSRRRGNSARSLELGERALALLTPDNFAFRDRASYVLGLVHYDFGQLDDVRSCMSNAYEMAQRAGDYLGAADALTYMAVTLTHQGQLREAERVCRHAIELGGEPANGMAR
jgi:LuxR family transcriptional regulator, maltose regulon positive regulatory protein